MQVRTAAPLILLSALLTLGACSGEETDPGDERCTEQGEPDRAPADSDAPLIGSITLRDSRDFTLDESGVPLQLHRGFVQASFVDTSLAGTSTPAQFTSFGDLCRGRISRPQPANPGPTFLALSSLKALGTARGSVEVPEISTGRFVETGEPLLLGAAEITVKGESSPAGFPAFELSIEAPSPLELSAPATDGTALLSPGELEIRWTPGNGDAVVVAVSPNTPSPSGGQVICEVRDDGCFALPFDAVAFLLAEADSLYNLTVSRVRFVEQAAREDAWVAVEAVSEARASLKNGAVR